MNTRTVCRICKTEGVRLHCITNTHLQEMYEREAHILLSTENEKPTLACIECCDRLQRCYQLRNAIEQTENTHIMMNLDPQLQIGQNGIHQNNTCVVQSDVEKCVKMEPEQLSDDEVKHENITVIENEILQDNEIELEQNNQNSDTVHLHGSAYRIIKVEFVSLNQDSQNITTTVKMESCDEQGVVTDDVIQWSHTEDNTLHNHKPSQEIPLKTVQILLQRCDDIIATANKTLQHNAIQLMKNNQHSATDHGTAHTMMNMNQNQPKKITTTVKIESCDEQGVECNDVIHWSDTEDDTLHNQKQSQDIPLKTVQILLQRCDDIIDEKNEVSWTPMSENLENISRKQKKTNATRKNAEKNTCEEVTFSESRQNQLTLRNDVPELKQGRKSNAILRNNTSRLECDVCKKVFSWQSHLIIHLRKHTGEKPFECNVCKKRFSQKTGLAIHARTHTGVKPFECDVCKKRYSEKSYLAQHAHLHTGKKFFECDICKKLYNLKSSLVKHTRITHFGQKPFECDVCKKCFGSKYHLNCHIRIHTGEKPFECDVCKKRYSDKSRLAQHARVHTGEKPFTCDVCKKRFSLKLYLALHARVHTGEKPFECDVCKKCFTQRSNLSKHALIHTGDKLFGCDECKRHFFQKADLVKHIRTHTGDKPFECDVCKKSFCQKNELTSHTRVHTGEKPFKCDVCKKKFSHKSGLTIHTRTQH